MFCEFEEDVLGQRSIYIKKTGNSDLQINFFFSVKLFVVKKSSKFKFSACFFAPFYILYVFVCDSCLS